MNLLIINYMALPVPPVKGGAVEYLIDEFLKDNEITHNHDITVYSIFDENAKKQSKEYKYTNFKFIEGKGGFYKLNKIVRHFINRISFFYVGNAYIANIVKTEKDWDKYDAIIIENAPEFGLLIPRKYRSKLILHLHNDYLNSNTKNAQSIFNCYRKIYTISNSLGECVQTIEKSDKIVTLYNGIDLRRFSFSREKREALRKKYNISDSDLVFMYSGRIVPDKGVYEMIKAFSEIKDESVKLLIVGGTRYSENSETKYMKNIEKISDERVIYTGFVPYSNIQDLYSAVDVGMVPSIFNDPFNLTVIEFCSSGVPVIISDRGAMKELVNSKCSIIAECDDNFIENLYRAMKYIADNRKLIHTMGKKAKSVSENYGIDKYCAEFNKLLMSFGEENHNEKKQYIN